MQLERPGWRTPPHALAMAKDQVHVWRATLDWPQEQAAHLQQWLAADERERMDRFRSGRDRHRYLVGRGMLRMVIGRYLAVSPGALRFDTTAAGKPQLAPGVAAQPLQFNLSHSGDLVLIALTSGRALGVDVEQVRADVEPAKTAARFFSPTDQRALATLSGARQIDAFFDCWVRKEAYVKARGDGLSLPLELFDVSLLPGEAAQLIETRPDRAEASRWRITALDAGDGYKAALAVEGGGWILQQWDCGKELSRFD